jgi:hypothetical protein
MAYQMFKKQNATRRNGKFLTITKQGTMRFSKECYMTYFKDYDYVLFLYNRKTRCIGLKLKTDDNHDHNCYKIRKTKIKNSTIYSVSATAFLNFFGIDFSKTKKFKPVFIEKKEMIKIDLNEEV